MTDLSADPALPEDRAATIAEYIAALGEPRTRAEELVIDQMRRLGEQDARVQVIRDHQDTTPTVRLIYLKEQDGLWRAASELYFAVRAFRQHSGLPPIGDRSRAG